ncbi:MAG: hypothetical protein GVY35_00295 [Bacteroidetes bacterium]|jgi:hypothetical protein|nr:hypothetical protein [Bacteroidota bacterium]
MTRLQRVTWSIVVAVGLLGGGCTPKQAEPVPGHLDEGALRAQQMEDRVRVTVDGALFTEYKYADDQKYPYFFPVRGPRTGESVTTESSEPWPHHHSLFFGCDKVNGGNYWQEGLDRGQIVPQETHIRQASGDAVVFTQTSRWQRPGAPAPFLDERRIRITAPSAGLRIIDFEITLTSLIDVRIQQTNHALFSARMVPALSADSGGTLVNASGQVGEEGTWGEPSPWIDYWGVRAGETEGLAILNHPANRWSPPRWFTRNYGFFSPTPMNWLEGGALHLPKGEKLHLRYRVVVHEGDTEAAGIQRLYDRYAP